MVQNVEQVCRCSGFAVGIGFEGFPGDCACDITQSERKIRTVEVRVKKDTYS